MRLIEGGAGPLRVDDVELHVVGEDEALPFPLDVIVVEEDTWLSLAPPRDVLPESAGSEVVRTMTRAHDVEPLPLGTAVLANVTVKRTSAVIAKAIVIDLDQEPCCVPSSVTSAMRAILDECRTRKLGALRVPLLGALRGRVDVKDSARAIMAALSESKRATTLPAETGLVPGGESKRATTLPAEPGLVPGGESNDISMAQRRIHIALVVARDVIDDVRRVITNCLASTEARLT